MTRPAAPPARLVELRAEIERIDRSLLLLVAARLRAARQAVALRSSVTGRLAEPEQELRVLLRGVAWARELGLPEALVQRLFRTLIEEGKAEYRTRGAPSDDPTVTVFVAEPAARPADLRSVRGPAVVPGPR